MTMKLEQVRDWLLARANDGQMQRSVYVSDYQLREMAGAIGSHLTRPAQSVDDGTYEAIGKAFREVLSDPAVAWRDTGAKEFIARVGILTAALQEKGNG